MWKNSSRRTAAVPQSFAMLMLALSVRPLTHRTSIQSPVLVRKLAAFGCCRFCKTEWLIAAHRPYQACCQSSPRSAQHMMPIARVTAVLPLLVLLAAVVAGPCSAFKAEEFKVRQHGASDHPHWQPNVLGAAPGGTGDPLPCVRSSHCHSPLFPRPQNCADSAFCMRLRGNTSEAFVIVSESVKVEGPRVTATVANTEDANATFSLVLTAYGDTLRLWINEAPEKGRFEVPDVLVPGLEQREQVRKPVTTVEAERVAAGLGCCSRQLLQPLDFLSALLQVQQCLGMHGQLRTDGFAATCAYCVSCPAAADPKHPAHLRHASHPTPPHTTATAGLGGGQEEPHQAQAAAGCCRARAALQPRSPGRLCGRRPRAGLERRQTVHFRAPAGGWKARE